MSVLHVVARLRIDPRHRARLLEEMRRLVEETRREPGCLRYALLSGAEDEAVLVFVEEWRSRADWEAHMKGDALAGFNARIPDGAIHESEIDALLLAY